MERADKVLARLDVNRRLAADRTVHLRQQRCRNLDKPAAALENGRCKTRQVADNTAAKRDDVVAALDTFFQQPVDRVRQGLPTLRGFARFTHKPACTLACGIQRPGYRPAPVIVRIPVGDDWHNVLAQQVAALVCEIGNQPFAHAHVVTAPGKFDPYVSHLSSSRRIRFTATACGPLSLVTWIGASA